MVKNQPFPQGLQQQPPAPVPLINQQANYQVRPQQFNQQFSLPQVSPLLTPPQQYNSQVPPPYIPQYPPSNSPSTGSNDSSVLTVLQRQLEMQERRDRAHDKLKRQKEEQKRQKEERQQRQEECKKMEQKESQQRTHINKAFEKINIFDGSDPNYCFSWLEQIHSLVRGRDFREELLFNCGISISKTIHAIDPDAMPEQIKDAILHNHSNL